MEQYETELSASSQLRTAISQRRRSTSITEDYSVQKTNDDVTECKFAAAKLGYYEDPFLECFVNACPLSSAMDELPLHRDPEILRGYWARTAAIRSIVDKFLKLAGPSAQVVNLGAGYDTLYWRLKKSINEAPTPSVGDQFQKFVEVDFSTVTAKKIHQIQRKKITNKHHIDLSSYFSEPGNVYIKFLAIESQHCDLHAGDYHLIGADLRQPRELEEKLRSVVGLDPTAPTLLLAECVFVYMDGETSSLLHLVTRLFPAAPIAFVSYEQVNTGDHFTKVMVENLNRRGILLPGLSACETLGKQKQRFTDAGFNQVIVWTMDDVYCGILPPAEVSRIEKLEPLDERELLTQLLDHYSLLYAFRSGAAESEASQLTTWLNSQKANINM